MVWTVLVVVAAQHPVSLLHPLLQADMLQDKFRAEDEFQRSGQDARRCEHRLFCWWAGSAQEKQAPCCSPGTSHAERITSPRSFVS